LNANIDGITSQATNGVGNGQQGAVDLANNWSVDGRTRHVDVRNYFLRELKDEGVLIIKYVAGEDNEADIFTKNTSGPVFEKHIRKFVWDDEYMGEE